MDVEMTTKPLQPATTDATPGGMRAARNAMRLRLWADDVFAHRFLCHPEGECGKGCGEGVVPRADGYRERLALYESEME